MKKRIMVSLLAFSCMIGLSGCIKIYQQAPETEEKETEVSEIKKEKTSTTEEKSTVKKKEKTKTTQTTTVETAPKETQPPETAPATEAEVTQAPTEEPVATPDTAPAETQNESGKNQYQLEGEHWAKEFSNPNLTDAERAQLGREKGDYYRNKYGR